MRQFKLKYMYFILLKIRYQAITYKINFDIKIQSTSGKIRCSEDEGEDDAGQPLSALVLSVELAIEIPLLSSEETVVVASASTASKNPSSFSTRSSLTLEEPIGLFLSAFFRWQNCFTWVGGGKFDVTKLKLQYQKTFFRLLSLNQLSGKYKSNLFGRKEKLFSYRLKQKIFECFFSRQKSTIQ